MPLRTEKMGKVSAIRAADMSVEITEKVALDPNLDYTLPQGMFCTRFISNVDNYVQVHLSLLGRRGGEKMTITRSELLDVVYHFYPRGMIHIPRSHVPPGELAYIDTVERHRLDEASDRGRADYPRWKAMIDRLGEQYYLQNESMSLFAGGTWPAYSARIYRPKDFEPVPSWSSRASLSFHVSLLGPYYGIHDMGGPDEKPGVIAAEIEATYPGYQTIPPELGNEVVPDVDAHGAHFGEATIYVCLFSGVWTWVEPC